MIPWLRARDPFPPPDNALVSPNGLLAAGADLSVDRLLAAYRLGIFPWYGSGEPVLWWTPDPRMVLFVDELRVSRSLRKALRAAAADGTTRLTVDRAFDEVIDACSAPRVGQEGTWITGDMIAAYIELHRRQHAHSIEVWRGNELTGGLYGVSVGRMFYGESMFSRRSDASKLALAALVRLLGREGVPLIDCQQKTQHLASLGAREIPRKSFLEHVSRTAGMASLDWAAYHSGDLTHLLSSY